VKRESQQRKMRCQKPKRSSFHWGIALLVFVFCVGGCGGGSSPPNTIAKKDKLPPVEQKKAEVAPTAVGGQKEPEQKGGPDYVYSPSGKPDPFKPFIQLGPMKESSKNVPLTPLQRYEISQLKLVAIVTAPDGGTIALVEDSTGKGYFLKKGTWIGNNDGKVTRILKDKVIIEESYQDVFGKTKINEVSLQLHRTEEGIEP
jgi:Tfp pilus assembly protein PilP